MRKLLYFLFLLVLVHSNCSKDNTNIPDCTFENPIEELNWLKQVKNSLTNCSCQTSIIQGKFREETVFYTRMDDPACNSIFNVTLWDCNGDVVKEYKFGDSEVFYKEVDYVRNLYTCSD